MRYVSVHVKVSWKVYGVFDTVENRTRLPSALGQILQRLSAHRTMRESSFGIGMGVTGGRRNPETDALTRESARVGFLGKRAGAGMERWWREMDHSVWDQCLCSRWAKDV